MLSFYVKDRDSKLKGYDYIFGELKKYEGMKDYFAFPKMTKEHWKVAVVELTLEESRQLIEMKQYDHLDLHLYLRKDVHSKLMMELQVEETKQLSSWDKFQLKISESQFLFDPRAARELYNRTSSNPEALDEILSELQSLFFDTVTISMSHINKVSVREDKVYARDVILTLLLFDNQHIPKKGSRFSRYKYKNWETQLVKLQDAIGRRAAFFSMAKYLKHLYKEKMKYLENKDVDQKNIEIFRYVDVYELLHAHSLFEISNEKQTEAILWAIDGRRKVNVSLF